MQEKTVIVHPTKMLYVNSSAIKKIVARAKNGHTFVIGLIGVVVSDASNCTRQLFYA
jgi:hypothetical protein